RSSLAASVFSDVLKYDNDVGPDVASIGRSLGCCRAGAGFDEASGWGSVDVASFANRALLTQPARVALSIPAHQRPVRNHKILATVSCSLSCRMGAIALVQIGSSKPFEIASRVHRIHAAGRKKIALVFSSRQLQRLRSALSRHQRIESEIF